MPNKFLSIPFINPLINDEIDSMGSISGINTNHTREIPIVVSLCSNRNNFRLLQKTLYSLLNQTIKPDKIILWLDSDTEDMLTLPYEITRFIKNGVEIRFVKSYGQYTNIFYAVREFRNCIIVTAEDYIYYRKNWLKKLYLSYIANSSDIHVHMAHRVKMLNGNILPVAKWKNCVNEETARYDNFIIKEGGVLYPPNCFSNEVLRSDIFLKYAADFSCIWLWIMALLNNKKIRVIKNHYRYNLRIGIFRHIFKKNKKGYFDKQLKSLLDFYGQNVINKLNV